MKQGDVIYDKNGAKYIYEGELHGVSLLLMTQFVLN